MKSVKQITLPNLSVAIADFSRILRTLSRLLTLVSTLESHILLYSLWEFPQLPVVTGHGFLNVSAGKKLLYNHLETHDFERLMSDVVFSLCLSSFTE